MKKILLLTSALLAAAGAYAKEQAPRLTISGESSFQGFFHKQSQREQNGGRGGNGTHFGIEDTRINFDVLGKSDLFGAGFDYSLLVGVNTDPSESNNFEENRLMLKSDYFTMMAGVTRGVDDFMSVGAFKVQGGSGGGFDGNMKRVLNLSTGVYATSDLRGTSKDSTKINLVSPRVNGFQVGLTFTPNTEQKGQAKPSFRQSTASVPQPFDKNHWSFGANYKNTFVNGFNLQASATAVVGRTQTGVPAGLPYIAAPGVIATTNSVSNTKSWALGLVMGYQGFDVGVEYIDNGKSREVTQLQGSDAGKVLSVALGYTWGNNKISGGVYTSKRKLGNGFNKAETQVLTLAYDRKLAKGLSSFIETNFHDLKTDANYVNTYRQMKAANPGVYGKADDATPNNKGHVVIVGGRVRF